MINIDKKKIQYVTFVLDMSGSMAGLSTKLIQCYNDEVRRLKEDAKTFDVETYVRVLVFGDTVFVVERNGKIESPVGTPTFYHIDSAPRVRWANLGMTALFDAIGYSVKHFKTSSLNDESLLVLAITDGEENSSKQYNNESLSKLIERCNAGGRVTISIRCPQNTRATLIAGGIPQDNITVWDTGSAAAMAAVSSATQSAITNYYKGRAGGQSASRSFYTPDTTFSPTTLKRSLTDITHQVVIAGVTASWGGKQIRDFVEKELLKTYVKGNAYYQLTKKETVQKDKSIIIRDVKTGRIYGDEDSLDLLGLPKGQEIVVVPSACNSQYEIFIQSNSVNRKLVAGTKILYRTI